MCSRNGATSSLSPCSPGSSCPSTLCVPCLSSLHSHHMADTEDGLFPQTTWYLTTCYLLYTEASGHSGIRLYWGVPTTFFLRYFGVGMELCLEGRCYPHRMATNGFFF